MSESPDAGTPRTTDRSLEAIRYRVGQSIVWADGEVTLRVSDALWAAKQDVRTLLALLDRTEPRDPREDTQAALREALDMLETSAAAGDYSPGGEWSAGVRYAAKEVARALRAAPAAPLVAPEPDQRLIHSADCRPGCSR